MKFLLVVIGSFIGVSPLLAHEEGHPEWEKIKCRITYYHPYQDKWGAQVADPKTKKAKQGVTISAHPHFKFGQEVFIPFLKNKIGDGHFIVQDRGSWVTKKKASSGKTYVFDVFVNSKSLFRKATKYQEYMYVYIKR